MIYLAFILFRFNIPVHVYFDKEERPFSSRSGHAMARGTKCLSCQCQCDQGENGLAENMEGLRIPIRRLAGILRKDRRGVNCKPVLHRPVETAPLTGKDNGSAKVGLPDLSPFSDRSSDGPSHGAIANLGIHTSIL
jgi:hypothetical protein